MVNSSVGILFLNHAVDFLKGHYLPKIERCLEQLSDEHIWWRANSETNSIGNLILHLCGNVRQWIVAGVGNQPDIRMRDQEFAWRDIIPREDLVSRLRQTIREAEVVLRELNPETLSERRMIQGKDVEVLEAVFHVTEHFSMHTGQIIVLTKILTAKDLKFYDFSTGVPIHDWN